MYYRLCIVEPNKNAFSETFIKAHNYKLAGDKRILYGGSFPIFDHNGNYLIKSKIKLIGYLIQKRILKRNEISIRDKALYNYFKSEKIDVVLAEYGMVGASIYKICKECNIPLIIHFHGADAHHLPTIQKFKHRYLAAFEYANSIIAVSKTMIEALKELGAPEDKILYNPYGIDLEKFTISEPEKNPKKLFFAGRFVEKKAPKNLILCFKKALETEPEAKLVLAGDGPLLESTKILVKELKLTKSVVFKGILTSDEVIDELQSSRAFVQYSVTAKDGDSEGTPNSILEASACGLPVISTKHAGINEAVINGKTGLLSDENDINLFSENMVKVLSDPEFAKNLGLSARLHIQKNYNILERIKTLDNLIQTTILNKQKKVNQN